MVFMIYQRASLALLHQKDDKGRQARTQRHENGLTLIRVRALLARARTGRTRHTVCDPDRQAGTRKWVDIYKNASVPCAR